MLYYINKWLIVPEHAFVDTVFCTRDPNSTVFLYAALRCTVLRMEDEHRLSFGKIPNYAYVRDALPNKER